MSPRLSQVLFLMLLLLWLAAQIVIQLAPLPPADPSVSTWPTDKLVHLFLGASNLVLLQKVGVRPSLSVVGAVAIAFFFEAAQVGLPDRTAELGDFSAALFGMFLASLLLEHRLSQDPQTAAPPSALER